MEERVREIGGKLTMQSGNGRGTTIDVDVPVVGVNTSA
jgi:signal transduction histidine kinase